MEKRRVLGRKVTEYGGARGRRTGLALVKVTSVGGPA